ncbi:MAG: CHAD domain-containing protein [Candidatus Limnocylindria bacterium]
MARLEPEELTRPPEEGARLVALRNLEDAATALARIASGEGADALHEFRVNLRRLRSTLQAFAPHLEPRPTEQALARLRDLNARSNAARDAEVQIAWLEARSGELSRSHRPALRWLTAELAARRDQMHARLLAKLPERFAPLRADLARSLAGYRTWVHLDSPDPSPTFAAVAGEWLRRQAARLRESLDAISSPSDNSECHQARIEAKRLRYLLEPVARYAPEGKRAVRSLKGLQDVLGEIHDLEILMQTIETSAERIALVRMHALLDAVREADDRALAAARRRSLEGGLLALTTLVRDRHRKLFGELEAAWLAQRGARFFETIEAGARALCEVRREPLEIERKFLLSGLPEIAREAPSLRIEQGWMAGERIRERLRRVSDESGERFYRTIKLGTGLTRAEYEESITREMFEPLWPLTKGCRVEKRRIRLRDGELTWEIDVFEGRELVTAEVELPSPDAELPIPEWLAPWLVREVTGDPAYSNLNLAR